MALGLIALPIAVLLLWFVSQVTLSYKGYPGPSRIVLIERGWTLQKIADTLNSQGIIHSSHVFRWYIQLAFDPSSLKAGEYQFEGPQNLSAVFKKIRSGKVHHRRITIPEGLTQKEIAKRLEAKGFGDEDKFLQAMKKTDLINDWDPLAKQNLEGYLFPETYFFNREADEQKIVQSMVDYFRQHWTTAHSIRSEELNLSIREVVILASLIEKETGLDRERSLISAVFQNRLKQNLRLASDPTVIYAVALIKEFDGIIHQSDLNLDSPYNTYIYPGLPPGPISNPGLRSIEAVLYPADVDYLYFVATNDGAHFFSDNYQDHSRAVEKYQR
ncbi:MAG: endolytic transglycosylase MltG [Acidobacteriota bacterium]|nr:endolytic transglycosylase MltG [Acidobacteriota bacterium]